MTRSAGRPLVLIVDDQPDVLESLRILLRSEGLAVESARSPSQALAVAERIEFDAALIDLNYAKDTTSGREGLDLLGHLRSIDASLPVVAMTAWGSVELAVEAMQRGASDFVEKPWENQRLLNVLRSQIELSRALRRGRRLEAENRVLRASDPPPLIASSQPMKKVLDVIAKIGPSDANVLITGEHGTGKDVVARTIHAVSTRAERAMITVDLGGLAEGVFAAELFGHTRGAFTDAKADRVGRFEMANGGTLFLDEIANIPQSQQATLLRALETGEIQRVGSSRSTRVDVRIVSATNAHLPEEVATGRFREDLLFRLNTVHVQLPPLRQRSEDIPALALHFLGRYTQRYAKQLAGFDGAALAALKGHSWPGNVRELSHVVERSVLLAETDRVRAEDLALERSSPGSTSSLEDLPLNEVERVLIERTMRRHHGNVSRAAESLGLSRAALYRRLEKHGL